MVGGPKIVGPEDGESIELGGMGVRFMVDGDESGGGFSLVEHPLALRALAADAPADLGAMGEFIAGYGFEVDVESVPGLCEEHGLKFGVG